VENEEEDRKSEEEEEDRSATGCRRKPAVVTIATGTRRLRVKFCQIFLH